MDWEAIGMGCVKAAMEALKEVKEVKALNQEINIQTNADLISHQTIINFLKKQEVKCNVFSEEEKECLRIGGGDEQIVFVVDPIDNTLLYLRGEVSFCSIALMILIDGFPKYSFVGDISTGEIYHCDEFNSYKDGEKIEVPNTIQGRPVILSWAPYKTLIEGLFNNLISLSGEKYYLYNFGGQLQAVKIATGNYDAYVEVKEQPANEFCAAVIVERAGGVISTTKGESPIYNPRKKQTLIIARNEEIHKDILERFRDKGDAT